MTQDWYYVIVRDIDGEPHYWNGSHTSDAGFTSDEDDAVWIMWHEDAKRILDTILCGEGRIVAPLYRPYEPLRHAVTEFTQAIDATNQRHDLTATVRRIEHQLRDNLEQMRTMQAELRELQRRRHDQT